MTNSLVVHIMLKEESEVSPKTSVQLEFVGACSNTKHLGLFWSYLPYSNSESHTVFFVGFLILQRRFYQNFRIFLNRSSGWWTSSENFFWGGRLVHRCCWSMALFFALLMPYFWLVWARVLQIGLGNSFRSNLGHFVERL